ncbi:MAG: helix-turn-helix domain-containing protein [Bacteroidetes bacterium]|nr:helix-turn-helix domain-containing protein [Bacteroidota bacterium]
MNKSISVYMFPFSSLEVDSAKELLLNAPEINIFTADTETSCFDHSVLLIHSAVFIDNPFIRKLIWKKQRESILLYGPIGVIRAAFTLPCTDFITYPFNKDELAARLFRAAPIHIQCSSGQRLSLSSDLLQGNLGFVVLSNPECEILLLLVSFFPEPVKRETIFKNLFPDLPQKSRYPDVIISSLRKKISSISAGTVTSISTIHGSGYRL